MAKIASDTVHMTITELQTYDPRSLLAKVAVLALTRLRDRDLGTPGTYLPNTGHRLPTPSEENEANARWQKDLTTAITALEAYVDDENFMDEAVDAAAQDAFLWITINLNALWD